MSFSNFIIRNLFTAKRKINFFIYYIINNCNSFMFTIFNNAMTTCFYFHKFFQMELLGYDPSRGPNLGQREYKALLAPSRNYLFLDYIIKFKNVNSVYKM